MYYAYGDIVCTEQKPQILLHHDVEWDNSICLEHTVDVLMFLRQDVLEVCLCELACMQLGGAQAALMAVKVQLCPAQQHSVLQNKSDSFSWFSPSMPSQRCRLCVYHVNSPHFPAAYPP